MQHHHAGIRDSESTPYRDGPKTNGSFSVIYTMITLLGERIFHALKHLQVLPKMISGYYAKSRALGELHRLLLTTAVFHLYMYTCRYTILSVMAHLLGPLILLCQTLLQGVEIITSNTLQEVKYICGYVDE